MNRIAALLLGTALSLGAAGAKAQELGRLFFTPEQRAALDARRKARGADNPAAAPVAESPITRIDGAVRRSGGKSTVWVNGKTIPEGTQPDGEQEAPKVSTPGRVSIPAAEGAQRHDLRVGESLDRGSGEVRDLIGEDAIKVKRHRAAPTK